MTRVDYAPAHRHHDPVVDLDDCPRHALPYARTTLETAIVTTDLLDDVLSVLAAHGEHPPRERTAACLDRLLLDADA